MKKLSLKRCKNEWIKSPAKDVLRKPLEREAAESGHTTSIVKYLPGASLKTHFTLSVKKYLCLKEPLKTNMGNTKKELGQEAHTYLHIFHSLMKKQLSWLRLAIY